MLLCELPRPVIVQQSGYESWSHCPLCQLIFIVAIFPSSHGPAMLIAIYFLSFPIPVSASVYIMLCRAAAEYPVFKGSKKIIVPFTKFC